MFLKRFVRNYWFLFLVAGVLIAIDQITKAYIRSNFIEGYDMWAPWDWMLPYARIVYVTNTGVAFGMLKGLGGIFTILAIIVSSAIIYYFPRVPANDWTLRLAMGLQLAGAVGNLIDRITQGGQVTDFISVGNFPVFNIADASITVGVGVLLLGIWLQERRQKQEELNQENLPASDPAGTNAAIDADPSSQDRRLG